MILMLSAAVAAPTFEDAFADVCAGPDSWPMEVRGGRAVVPVTLGDEVVPFEVHTSGHGDGLTISREVAERVGPLPSSLTVDGHTLALPAGVQWRVLDDREGVGWQTRKNEAPGQISAGFLSRFDLVCFDAVNGRFGVANIDKTPRRIRRVKPIELRLEERGTSGARYPFTWLITAQTGWGAAIDSREPVSTLESHAIEKLMNHDPYLGVSRGAWGNADQGASRPERVVEAPVVHLGSPPTKGPAPACPSCPTEDAAELRRRRKRPGVSVGPMLFVERSTDALQHRFGRVLWEDWLAGAVGNDVLLRSRTVLDYRRGHLWLDAGRRDDPGLRSERVGLSFSFDEAGCPVVRQVVAPSPVKVGDVLLRVDEHDACASWHHEVQAWLAGDSGAARTLVVRRGGEEVTLKARTRDVFEPPR